MSDKNSDVEKSIRTDTQVVLPILGCLKAAEEFLGTCDGWARVIRRVVWTPSNEKQEQFLKRFLEAKAIVDSLGDNLKRKADRDVSVINAWLKENGFDIQLEQVGGKSFAVASILDVLVEWVNEGTVTQIINDNGTYQAVKIKSENDGVQMYANNTAHPFPVVRVETKSGDLVFMSVLDSMPDDTFAITDKVDKIRDLTKGSPSYEHFDGVIFPMVDYDRRVDISWIEGMATGNSTDDWSVGQAVQQTMFRMNEKGARAKSAVGMTFRGLSLSKNNWIRIDKPFILWIERPGVDLPLFTGVFAEDVWNTPKCL